MATKSKLDKFKILSSTLLKTALFKLKIKADVTVEVNNNTATYHFSGSLIDSEANVKGLSISTIKIQDKLTIISGIITDEFIEASEELSNLLFELESEIDINLD